MKNDDNLNKSNKSKVIVPLTDNQKKDIENAKIESERLFSIFNKTPINEFLSVKLGKV